MNPRYRLLRILSLDIRPLVPRAWPATPDESLRRLAATAMPSLFRSGRSWNVRVGMETSGHARWFERLLTGLQFELWVGAAVGVLFSSWSRQRLFRLCLHETSTTGRGSSEGWK